MLLASSVKCNYFYNLSYHIWLNIHLNIHISTTLPPRVWLGGWDFCTLNQRSWFWALGLENPGRDRFSLLMNYLVQWVSDTGWSYQEKHRFYNLHPVGMLGIRLNILPYDSPDLGNHPIQLYFHLIRYPSLGYSRKTLPFQLFSFQLSSSIMPILLED